MRLAIMQPYFFPYPGYFELMASVDVFMYLTDVQYKRGWINRNRIRSASNWIYITVPVSGHKQTDKISEITISDQWEKICNKHIRSIHHIYKNPNKQLIDIYQNTSNYKNLCECLKYSLGKTCDYLGIKVDTEDSSEYKSVLSGEERIIDLCKKMGAKTYVNLPGGSTLYDKSKFNSEGINLEFMPMTTKGTLSILDYCFNENNLRIGTWPQQKSCTTI
jgi:hypothetical protein